MTALLWKILVLAVPVIVIGGLVLVWLFKDRPKSPIWQAWQQGQIETARLLIETLILSPETEMEARQVQTLIAHITGDYVTAVASFDRLSIKAKGHPLVQEAMFESLMHMGDAARALELSTPYQSGRETQIYYHRAKNLATNPMGVDFGGVFELPLVDSEISPFFPGVNASINGIETTVRFDTGGAFIHMSPSQARRFGVTTTDCATTYAGLQNTKTCIGTITEFTLGNARLTNVPVAVLDVLENGPLREIDDSPIIGTNIFEQFMVTIDTPRQRLIVSERGNQIAATQHLAMLPSPQIEVPFLLWGDHYMLAHGTLLPGQPILFFIDSGLVVGTPEHGQASIMIPKSIGKLWKNIPGSTMTQVPASIGLGSELLNNTMALVVPNRTWQPISEAMGGLRVDALLSYGYLKHFAWTIDFDRRVFLLRRST